MGLKDIIEAMADFFDQEQMDYGIIGAFALYSYGYVRATQDIDFITRAEYKDRIIKYLESLGFEKTFSSSAFSNHVHPVGPVRVNIMYIEGSTAEEIFKATEKRILLKDLSLPVVSPEHLIAMKLFAIQTGKTDRNTQLRLEPYLEFLRDAEPAGKDTHKPLLADKQFTL